MVRALAVILLFLTICACMVGRCWRRRLSDWLGGGSGVVYCDWFGGWLEGGSRVVYTDCMGGGGVVCADRLDGGGGVVYTDRLGCGGSVLYTDW